MNTNRELSALYKENMIEYTGAEKDSFVELYETAGSTDLGDLSQIMPCMHIWTEGITGGLHSKDYRLARYGTCLYRSGKDDGAYDH